MRSLSTLKDILTWTFVLPSLASAYTLDCSDVREDRKSWNLKPLGGPRSVYRIEKHPTTFTNTTFTIDICRQLERTKGVPADEDCPSHSRVCAIERLTNTVENVTTITHTIPIAGDFALTVGGDLDPHWTRLKSSASSADREKEGLRLELNGGKDGGKKQKAIVEFNCAADGTSDFAWMDGVMYAYGEDKDEDDKSGEVADDGHGGKLRLRSWSDEEDMKVLRLDWLTQYACEDAANPDREASSGHWGFFTWFIIIVFMAVAAYLIFGSWLNYNRYSARGWDLLPHSETIRDIPYLFRDWMRRVVNTVQGGGSRGGYSAV